MRCRKFFGPALSKSPPPADGPAAPAVTLLDLAPALFNPYAPPLAADILALVLDVGTCNTKGGFGGDVIPKCVVPSVAA